MQLDQKALIEEAVQASIDAGLAVNGEHGVAAARHAARFMFNTLQAVQPVPVAWQTEDEIRAITRAEYKAIQEADSGRGAYLRILYPKPLYSAPLPATASAEPVAWQSMDSAPKDGSWFAGMTTHHHVIPARWNDRLEAFEICNVKLKLKKWQPLPEPEPRDLIQLVGSAAPFSGGDNA